MILLSLWVVPPYFVDGFSLLVYAVDPPSFEIFRQKPGERGASKLSASVGRP